MKMRKIMAAGIAATMAVTSLAAVASAEAQTLTFDMKQSTGVINASKTAGTEYGSTADINTALAAAAADTTSANAYAAIVAGNGQILEIESNELGQQPWAYKIACNDIYAQGLALEIKGLKIVDETKSVEATASYDFTKGYKTSTGAFTTDAGAAASKKTYFRITLNENKGDAGQFVASQWARIDSVKVKATTTLETTSEAYYNIEDYKHVYSGIARNAEGVVVTEYLPVFKAWNATTGGAIVNMIAENVGKIDKLEQTDKSLNDKYALLEQTAPTNSTIYRYNVELLSDTHAYNSDSDDGKWDADQTYDDNGLGTSKHRFAGLASQVADFFNHKTNGTITFKFTLGSVGGSGWVNGGVPSTQVGIKNILNANNFALYVNYMSSTGSLEATTSVDKEAGTVSFDISEILADLGGQTKGVVTDLYYGLNQGIYYDWPYYGTGLLVEEVTLAYDDDAADEEDVIDEDPAEDEDEDEDVVVDEDEDEDEDVDVDEDEDEDVTVDEDEDEDEDEDIGGDMIDDEPTADDEEDANPGTGVALAVVPALVAAAAVVVSKKRK